MQIICTATTRQNDLDYAVHVDQGAVFPERCVPVQIVKHDQYEPVERKHLYHLSKP